MELPINVFVVGKAQPQILSCLLSGCVKPEWTVPTRDPSGLIEAMPQRRHGGSERGTGKTWYGLQSPRRK